MGFEPGAQMQLEKAATYFRLEIEKDCQGRHSFPSEEYLAHPPVLLAPQHLFGTELPKHEDRLSKW
jgi:hypothetical protein